MRDSLESHRYYNDNNMKDYNEDDNDDDNDDIDDIDDDELNAILWAAIKGPDVPMPAPVRSRFAR